MLIIISPSKTIGKIPAVEFPSTTFPSFLNHSNDLVKQLSAFSLKELKDFLGVSPSLAQLNFERLMQWSLPFTSLNSYPAIASFNGDVYEGINVSDFNLADLNLAQVHLRILSGLYGILKPMDLIQPYRLEMGSKLQVDNYKDLYQFWNDSITQSINQELSEFSNPVLLNLASQEYFKVINVNQIKGKIITPDFKEQKGSGYKTVAIHAKRARGLMVRFIIKNRISDVEQIKIFNSEGYYFHPDLSSQNRWVFVR